MPEFRSVLDKYDAKGNRRLPTAEEDAIQQDTTLEELLIGPGRVAASGIAKGAKNLINEAELFMRPKVKNSLYAEIPGGTRSGQYAVRNIRSPEEIEAIKESGYMLPKEGGKQQKYFTQTDNIRTNNAFGDNSVIRVPIDKVPANRAVSRKDVEMYNRDSDKFEPLKKGGRVKLSA